jgi:hypothetical protein
MQVLLLDVTSFALERVVTLATINKHLTADDTHGDTSGKHIQESSFSGTRDTHECSESTRLNPSVHVVENASVFLLDLDVVGNVPPAEDSGLLLNDVGGRSVALLLSESCTVHTRLLILSLLLERSGSVTPAEDENFTL